MKPNIPDVCISRCKTLNDHVFWHARLAEEGKGGDYNILFTFLNK